MNTLPLKQRAGLAHLFLMCTSRDLTPFFMEEEEALEAFQTHVLKKDMPVRMASNLIATGAVMDLVLGSLARRRGPEGMALSKLSNVVNMEGPMWSRTVTSWFHFREKSFSAAHIVQWFASEAKKEKGN